MERRTLRITIELPDCVKPVDARYTARYTASDVLAMIAADGNFDDAGTRVKIDFVSPFDATLPGVWYEKASAAHFDASGDRFMEVA